MLFLRLCSFGEDIFDVVNEFLDVAEKRNKSVDECVLIFNLFKRQSQPEFYNFFIGQFHLPYGLVLLLPQFSIHISLHISLVHPVMNMVQYLLQILIVIVLLALGQLWNISAYQEDLRHNLIRLGR
jgi:hypothetical protein